MRTKSNSDPEPLRGLHLGPGDGGQTSLGAVLGASNGSQTLRGPRQGLEPGKLPAG